MAHVTYFAAITLDGRIAGPSDDLAFLDTFEGTFPDGPYAMATLIAGYDSLVMGSTTFRVIRQRIEAGLHETWPYGGRPAWVLTRAGALPPVRDAAGLRAFAGDVRELKAQLDRHGVERTWLVGGGDLAGQFFAADLVDEIILGVAPTLVGRGPALADGVFPLRRFDLVHLERSGSAVVLHYRRPRRRGGGSPSEGPTPGVSSWS